MEAPEQAPQRPGGTAVAQVRKVAEGLRPATSAVGCAGERRWSAPDQRPQSWRGERERFERIRQWRKRTCVEQSGPGEPEFCFPEFGEVRSGGGASRGGGGGSRGGGGGGVVAVEDVGKQEIEDDDKD